MAISTSQTIVDVSHIVEPNARTAVDYLADVLATAGLDGTGTLTIGGTNTAAITGTTITANTAFSGPTTGVVAGTNAAAGKVGEVIGGQLFGTATTATVTITIAAPGVVTWTAHGFSTVIPQPVVFTTTIALPTGITSGTVYYTVPSFVTTNTFQIATSIANAIAGTSITTSGSQSGVQTGTAGCAMANTTVIDVTGMALTAGDWDVWGSISWNLGTTTTWTKLEASISQTTATLATSGAVVGSSYSLLAQISAAATNGVSTLAIPMCQVNVSGTTNIFMPVKGTFAISTAGAYGFLFARRRR